MNCTTVYFHPVDCVDDDKKLYGHIRCEIYRNKIDPTLTKWALDDDDIADEWELEQTPEEKIDAIAADRLNRKYNNIPVTEIIIDPETKEPSRQPTGETYSRNGKTWTSFKEVI